MGAIAFGLFVLSAAVCCLMISWKVKHVPPVQIHDVEDPLHVMHP
ncbi:MAG TPA: hypothetical protein VFV52_15465 [Bacilli bacterium]|nr:hypothetical protein [Bacilli bacterium]